MKVKRFILSSFTVDVFTFGYLSVTVTGLPTYHNRSSCVISKVPDVKGRDKNGNKQREGMEP